VSIIGRTHGVRNEARMTNLPNLGDVLRHNARILPDKIGARVNSFPFN
jgi:hypothetical protein